ncbi:MAG: hypothetical protein IKE43_00875 [Coriobacteriales bacterium]|nr:hypothetical protein [Coriobacteriales bacterium]
MSIRNDYILDMINQFADSICDFMLKSKGGLEYDAIQGYEEIVGRALDMDAQTVLELSPASLVTMFQISATDESLAIYAVFALERVYELLLASNEPLARLRHEQATAIAASYGFDLNEVPPEVQERLDASEPLTV